MDVPLDGEMGDHSAGWICHWMGRWGTNLLGGSAIGWGDGGPLCWVDLPLDGDHSAGRMCHWMGRWGTNLLGGSAIGWGDGGPLCWEDVPLNGEMGDPSICVDVPLDGVMGDPSAGWMCHWMGRWLTTPLGGVGELISPSR